MSFYKKDADTLLTAPDLVIGPGFELHAAQHANYTYPVGGWYWFDDLDTALRSLAPELVRPDAVTSRQIRQAMTRTPFGEASLREAVDFAVLSGDQDLRDWWQYSTMFERNHPQVLAMTAALGKTEAELDALFALAATL